VPSQTISVPTQAVSVASQAVSPATQAVSPHPQGLSLPFQAVSVQPQTASPASHAVSPSAHAASVPSQPIAVARSAASVPWQAVAVPRQATRLPRQAKRGCALECGDSSPLSAGDWSQSKHRAFRMPVRAAAGASLDGQCRPHAVGFWRRPVACGKRRELAALHKPPSAIRPQLIFSHLQHFRTSLDILPSPRRGTTECQSR
jgi:hypothetical protein